MRKRWKIWAAGPALSLLVVGGAGISLCRLFPSEADRAAGQLWVGMPLEHFEEVLAREWPHQTVTDHVAAIELYFDDHSWLRVHFSLETHRLTALCPKSPEPEPMPDRLLRLFAKAFPGLIAEPSPRPSPHFFHARIRYTLPPFPPLTSELSNLLAENELAVLLQSGPCGHAGNR